MIHKPLSSSERIVAWRLSTGRTISHTEFLDALYGTSRPIPDTASKVVQVRIHAVRHAVRPLGIEIRTFYGIGYMVEAKHLDRFRDLLASEIAANVRIPHHPKIKRTSRLRTPMQPVLQAAE